jgi:hypothetical protein
MTEDNAQQGIKIMGNAAGKLPHCLQFLALPDLFFELFDRCNVSPICIGMIFYFVLSIIGDAESVSLFVAE